jgi:hypothetical protein
MSRVPFRPAKKKEQARTNVGRLGMTQAISTFGVGSIYEMRTSSGGASMILHSVMVAGLDLWPNDSSSIIREPSLERALIVDYFRRPPLEESKNADTKAIPAVRFPGVYYCDKCGMVGRVGKEFSDVNFGGVRCAKSNCSGKGVPFRFVVACHDKQDSLQPGHIEDFPYDWWAHGKWDVCEKPSIRLITSEEKSGLEGMVLYCDSCKKSQSLAGIFSDMALAGKRCSGGRPWLGDREDNCRRPLRVLQRGASNVYFPVTASAISIPPFSDRLLQLLNEAINYGMLQTIKDGKPNALEFLVDAVRNTPGLDDTDVFTDDQIREGLLLLAGVSQINVVQTEAEQKRLERNALVAGQQDEENGELLAIPSDLTDSEEILSGFARHLIQVHRLREVRALRGFQRVDPGFDGDPYQVACAPISKAAQKWLPAIEVRGEGIYLELNPDAIAAWEMSQPVKQRIGQIRENYLMACKNAEREPGVLPSARFVLAHTLSHMLMKQLSLECGYSGSSLRERLYVFDDSSGESCTGFLIYTASTSADGTLGGLVSQGEPRDFEAMLRSAISSARWCSSDPLCIESSGQGVDALNLAACHACSLIAETSCERRNTFLDRGLVIGLLNCPEIGFFHPALDLLD